MTVNKKRLPLSDEEIKESNRFGYDIFLLSNDTPFKSGQCYTKNLASKYVCKCGNDKFYVGSDDYWTGIRCPNCGAESCVHDG